MSHEPQIDYEDKVRALLGAVRSGNRDAFDQLIQAVGHEMRKLSAYRLRQQGGGQTLQTTALVNEAVVRLIQMLNSENARFPETKEHFMALVSRMMRFTLADYARRRKLVTATLDNPSSGDGAAEAQSGALANWSARDLDDLLSIDQALTRLEHSDAEFGRRRAAAIELYLFGGMNFREIGDHLGVTDDMARRDCQFAIARLRESLTDLRGHSGSGAC
jgi:RNA polymerase sigma factor (TIGR02999 family)